MIHLKDKVIVVTGGSGLIGAAFVAACREAGAICVNADLSCVNDLEKHTISLDITQEDSIITVITQVIARFGRIDGWVNNAYPRTKDWGSRPEDLPMESWRQNLDMHLTGYYACCKHVIEAMTRQEGGGAVVNIASMYGVVAPDFTVYDGTPLTSPIGYAAIKGGIIQLSRFLASYYGPQQIRVNCLSPGGIFDNQNPVFVQNYEHKVPMRRMGLPDDLTGGLVFLLSDSARYVTGQNLIVDGGWTAI